MRQVNYENDLALEMQSFLISTRYVVAYFFGTQLINMIYTLGDTFD